MKALGTVCRQNKSSITNPVTPSLPTPHTITTSLFDQCKKKQLAYRVVAIETIGGVASALEVDIFVEFSKIALPIIHTVRTLFNNRTSTDY